MTAGQDEIQHLRAMLQDRGKVVFYPDGLPPGSRVKHDETILIAGDVPENAVVESEWGSVYVLGNVDRRAKLKTDNDIIVTGTVSQRFEKESAFGGLKFRAGGLKFRVGSSSPDSVTVLHSPDPRGAQSVRSVMEKLGQDHPLYTSSGIGRKAFTAALMFSFGAAAALGQQGIKDVFNAASEAEIASLVFDAVCAHYIRAAIGVWVGYIAGNIGRETKPALALKNGAAPGP